MKTLQSVFDELERKAKAVLDEAGSEGRSVVLKAVFDPRDGCGFEVLAAQSAQAPVRRSLAKAASADELLSQLRAKVTVPNPQSQPQLT